MPPERAVRWAALAPLVTALDAALRGRPARRWLIGFSGGADSTALLLGVLALRDAWRSEGRAVPGLRALHVHHGMQPEADAWAARAKQLALGHGVAMLSVRVDVAGHTETAARAARYGAFERVLAKGDLLLLAHHADDDAETVLMDVLRGAGVRAMPATRTLGEGMLLRPLIGIRRERLRAAVAAHDLGTIEDPANADTRHARALVRHRLLPLADAAWPGLTPRLRQLARAQAERDAALALLLQPLLRHAVDDDGGLRRALLRSQPLPVARALLSAWLMPRVGPLPMRHLSELLRQLLTLEDAARFAAPVRGHRLHCHRDTVYLLAAGGPAGTLGRREDDAHADGWAWDGCAPLDTTVGRLRRLPAIRGMRWPDTGLQVRLRRGGERLRMHEGGPSRAVKSLLREAGIPAWQRTQWPLLFAALPCAGQAPALIAVPAVGVAAGWLAAAGEPGFTIAFDPGR